MTVSSNEAKDMCRNITEEEINDALSSFDDNKAPGPDGFTSKFFKAAWSIAGRDVYDVVKEFFQIGKFLSEINAKLITLVPKVKAHLKYPVSHADVDVDNFKRQEGNVLFRNQDLCLRQELLEYMDVHNNDASKSSQPSWGKCVHPRLN
nr:RNA-directed DNA polymerase, eukaryota, reverse transcriptase zinc-binding domain protein [Tanacetum cinerariifolium]